MRLMSFLLCGGFLRLLCCTFFFGGLLFFYDTGLYVKGDVVGLSVHLKFKFVLAKGQNENEIGVCLLTRMYVLVVL